MFLSQVVRVAQRCTEALELGVARTDDVAERPSVWEQLDMAQEVMAQGYLLKKKRATGGQGHHWVTRWFVLRADDCLYSFKSENVRVPCYSDHLSHVALSGHATQRGRDAARGCCEGGGGRGGSWRPAPPLSPGLEAGAGLRGQQHLAGGPGGGRVLRVEGNARHRCQQAAVASEYD